MTQLEGSTLSSGSSGVAAAVEAGVAIAAPSEVEPGKIYTVVVPADGVLETVDLDKDEYREHPRRKEGTVKVHDAKSFVAYLTKHGLAETEVWADASRQNLVAVVNAHMGVVEDGVEDYAGWSDHRVQLELRKTPAWLAWEKLNSEMVSQTRLAEHLEDRVIDIVSPTGADMLELAQSFEATAGVNFKSSARLDSGERELRYEETVTARAGQSGALEIPKEFALGLVPFEGCETYRVTARFRYRINSGNLLIGYVLDRPEDVLRSAFLDLVDAVENHDAVTAPVYRGTPA